MARYNRWLDQVRTFGLHLARLDVRQDSRYYETVMAELFDAGRNRRRFRGVWPKPNGKRLLTETCGQPVRWNFETALGRTPGRPFRCSRCSAGRCDAMAPKRSAVM